MPKVFLSHAAIDKPIAELLRSEIQDRDPNMTVFLSSRPGHIPTGAEWWSVIQRNLREAERYIILLTPNSINRTWIAFETGAAWMSERAVLMVAAGELDRSSVPPPLSFFQISSLEIEAELEAFLQELDLPAADLETFRMSVIEAGAGTAHPNLWEGVTLGNRFFAWEGPTLHDLDDRPLIPTPDGLIDAIKDKLLVPSYGLPEKLVSALGRGRKQVFETDRKTWRREVRGEHGDQVLLVHAGDE